MLLLVLVVSLWMGVVSGEMQAQSVKVGSKNFTESYILANLLVETIEKRGFEADPKFGMGGSGLLFQSLQQGSIDIYPEYTGTIVQALLKRQDKDMGIEELNQLLKPLNLVVSQSLGFNNSYGLAVRREFAKTHGLKTISDLKKVSAQMVGGFEHEFLKRSDGFYSLMKSYNLPPLKQVKGMDHSLAYEALAGGSVDLIDIYTTDGKLEKFDFVTLSDDQNYFPKYYAVWISRLDFVKEHPRLWQMATEWEGKISDSLMTHLNADVEEKRATAKAVLYKNNLIQGELESQDGRYDRIKKYGVEHLYLVLLSVGLAILLGFPLAFMATHTPALKHGILMLSSAVQTIPSLALLCFLIPVFGVGFVPSIVALVLYALLPIVINSYTGLSLIDRELMDMAKQLGMNRWQKLWHVQVPMSLPYVLAGIKTSLITSIGTATLAALIGAGGFGTPILTGLALNDYSVIMEGAIPVCILALIAQILFQVLEKKVVSPGLY